MVSNVEKHRAAHEAFNARDWDALVKDFADEVVYTDHPRGLTVKSKQEFVEWLKGWPQALSDAAVSEPTYHDAGDTTIAVFTGVGTNDGPLGSFPASNRRLSWPLCEILSYDAQGKVVRGEIYYDMATMLIQAGHMEPPPPQ